MLVLQESKNARKKNYTTTVESKTLNSMNIENVIKKIMKIPT